MYEIQTHHMIKFCIDECKSLDIENLFFGFKPENGNIFLKEFKLTKKRPNTQKVNEVQIAMMTIDQDYIDRLWNLISKSGIGLTPASTRRMIRDLCDRETFFNLTLDRWIDEIEDTFDVGSLPSNSEIIFNAKKGWIAITNDNFKDPIIVSTISMNGKTIDKMPPQNLGEAGQKRLVLSDYAEPGSHLVWVH